MRKAVFRDDASGLSITDAHVVNHSIKAAYLIQLLDHPVQIVPLSANDSQLVNMAALAAFNVSG